MQKFLLVLIMSLCFPFTSFAADPSSQEIVDSLSAFVDQWNQGDMNNALKIYKYSDSTEFISSASVIKGYTNIVDYFEMNYPSQDEMGKMSFSDIQVSFLTPSYATAVGKWALSRDKAKGGSSSGVFTVVFEKTTDGWKIALDHTTGVKTEIA